MVRMSELRLAVKVKSGSESGREMIHMKGTTVNEIIIKFINIGCVGNNDIIMYDAIILPNLSY